MPNEQRVSWEFVVPAELVEELGPCAEAEEKARGAVLFQSAWAAFAAVRLYQCTQTEVAAFVARRAVKAAGTAQSRSRHITRNLFFDPALTFNESVEAVFRGCPQIPRFLVSGTVRSGSLVVPHWGLKPDPGEGETGVIR